MAKLDSALDALKAELAALLADEAMQDIDIMVSHHDADVLIAATQADDFDLEEKSVVRSALLVRCYDLERTTRDQTSPHSDIARIRNWIKTALPGGQIPKRYFRSYIRKALQGDQDS